MEGMDHDPAVPTAESGADRSDFDAIWKTFRIALQARFVKYAASSDAHRETEDERHARELALIIGFGPWFAEEYGESGERIPKDVQEALIEVNRSVGGGLNFFSSENIDSLIRESMETPRADLEARGDAEGKVLRFISKMNAAYASRKGAA